MEEEGCGVGWEELGEGVMLAMSELVGCKWIEGLVDK